MTSYLFFVIITLRIEIIVVGGVLMEQKMIHKTSEKCVFFMKDNNLDFYLIIPNSTGSGPTKPPPRYIILYYCYYSIAG